MRTARAPLLVAAVVYAALVATAAAKLGANYEEVVHYTLRPLDVRDPAAQGPANAAAPFVASTQLPRLAIEPRAGVRLPLLTQLYMTDHLSYGGVLTAHQRVRPRPVGSGPASPPPLSFIATVPRWRTQ